jgi:hypothetical protein
MVEQKGFEPSARATNLSKSRYFFIGLFPDVAVYVQFAPPRGKVGAPRSELAFIG